MPLRRRPALGRRNYYSDPLDTVSTLLAADMAFSAAELVADIIDGISDDTFGGGGF